MSKAHGLVLAWVVVFAAGCGGRNNFQCEMNESCDLTGGGKCVGAATGNHWCAYPDPVCPGGYRYSDQDVGDGLSGVCVGGEPGPDAGVVDGSFDASIDGPAVVPGSWGKQIPGTGFESVDGLAFASDGSVLFSGSFDGTLDIGGGPLAATGTADAFVAKFTADGSHVWSRRFGGSSSSGVNKVRVLANGDVVIGGMYRGSITIGTTTLTSAGDQDVFIARLSPTGIPIWSVTGGSAAMDTLADLEVDANGNIYACGGFNGTGTFFGSALSGSYDPWLVRLTGTGTTSWAKAIAAAGIDTKCAVAVVSSDVVLVADFNGTTNVGGSTFTSVSNTLDIIVARFAAADGAHVWSKQFGGNGNDEAWDVDGNAASVVLTGNFGGSLSFGGTALTAVSTQDAFVAKLDASNGSHQVSAKFGGTSDDKGQHVAIRSDGQISVSGIFAGSANFGGTTITSNGDFDPFLVDIDGATGAVVTVKSVGGASRDEAHDVASSADSLAFAGSFAGSIMVLNQPFTSMGGLDGYVIRYKR